MHHKSLTILAATSITLGGVIAAAPAQAATTKTTFVACPQSGKFATPHAHATYSFYWKKSGSRWVVTGARASGTQKYSIPGRRGWPTRTWTFNAHSIKSTTGRGGGSTSNPASFSAREVGPQGKTTVRTSWIYREDGKYVRTVTCTGRF